MNEMTVAFGGFHFPTHEILNGCKHESLPSVFPLLSVEVKQSQSLWTHLCDLETIYLRREQEVEDAMATDNRSQHGMELMDRAALSEYFPVSPQMVGHHLS